MYMCIYIYKFVRESVCKRREYLMIKKKGNVNDKERDQNILKVLMALKVEGLVVEKVSDGGTCSGKSR